MLISDQDLLAILGLTTSSATTQHRVAVASATREATGAVKRILGYDPEQSSWTEILPRADVAGGIGQGNAGGWDVNAQHTRAIYERRDSLFRTLQLPQIPVRQVSSVYLDQSADFGQASGAFAASTLLEQGTDYWIEWDRPYSGSTTKGLCRSGCLINDGNWPATPGSVKVTYRAGYSPDELAGLADTDATASDGTITMSRVDASAIKKAARLIAVKAFHTWIAYAKGAAGFRAGTLASESAGDYSYSLAGGGAGISDMTRDVPQEAAECLSEFVNMGILLRG